MLLQYVVEPRRDVRHLSSPCWGSSATVSRPAICRPENGASTTLLRNIECEPIIATCTRGTSWAKRRRLTQSFLDLSDDALAAVPVLEKSLLSAINTHLDEHHSSTGTVVTALACVVGEFILASGNDGRAIKDKFSNILENYISTGEDGLRIGPDSEKSLVRKPSPWRG